MPLSRWKKFRARAQKKKAIQMLVLSGVVRPSHIEPRYYVPLIQLKTRNQTYAAASQGPSPGPRPKQPPTAAPTAKSSTPTWSISSSWAPLLRKTHHA